MPKNSLDSIYNIFLYKSEYFISISTKIPSPNSATPNVVLAGL